MAIYFLASSNPAATEMYYYHSDHLGTGTFLSDFSGNPYQFFLNLPFGETMIEQHSYSGDYTNKYKFNGKELDEETGLYYYGARYFNPRTSIWLSVDPEFAKFPGWSPYNYCMQNPVNLVDPDGKAPDDWKRNINGQVVYDKTLTSTSPLGFGETYLGKTYEDVALFGVCGLNTYTYYQEGGNSVSIGGNFQGESNDTSSEVGKNFGWFTVWGDCRSGDVTGLKGTTSDSVEYDKMATLGNGNGTFGSVFKSASGLLAKLIKFFEIADGVQDTFDRGKGVGTIAEPYFKKNDKTQISNADTLFSVTRKIDTENNNIDIVNGSRKADSIIKRYPNAKKKVENIIKHD